MSAVRRIFAMGGGGFTMEPGNPALDDYVLDLAVSAEPRICLLPTAGGDSEAQIARFYTAFSGRRCRPSHLSLFRLGDLRTTIRHHLLAQDIIYAGGGSLLNLLAIWGAHEVDAIMREAWRSGVVLCGISAGAMCWFEAGVTRSSGRPATASGLGLLPGSASVHFDGEPERRPVYLDAVHHGAIPPGWGIDDGAGLLFEGRRLVEVVSSRPAANAVWVEPGEAKAAVTTLPTRFLGASGAPAPRAPFAVTELRLARLGAHGVNGWGRQAGLRD